MTKYKNLNLIRYRKRQARLARKNDRNPQSPIPFHIRYVAKWYKLGYFGAICGFLVLGLTTPRTYYHNEKYKESINWWTTFLVICCSVSYLTVQCTDPGYIIDKKVVELESIETPKPDVEGETAEPTSVDTNIIEVSIEDTSLKQRKREAVTLTANDEESDSDLDWTDSEDEEIDLLLTMHAEEPDETGDMELSGMSKDAIPIRSKYCRHSRCLVATYDHYCAVLGTCIGEKNHFRFWILLLTHTIGISYLLYIIHSGFHDTPAFVSTWLNYNSHALAAAIVFWILLASIGGLFIFHSFLLMANLTSYEFMRSEKISYLNHTKDFDLPFSNGIFRNLWFCISQDGYVHHLLSRGQGKWKRRIWEPVGEIERDSENVCENLWENKYWSCC